MGGLLHLVQRGGDWPGPQPAQAHPCCTKCNSPCTNVPITVLLYNGPLLCGFNVSITGLTRALLLCEHATPVSIHVRLRRSDDKRNVNFILRKLSLSLERR